MRFDVTTRTWNKEVKTYEEVCENFPWFSAVVPDEEYAEFNEFETVTLTISRMTMTISKHKEDEKLTADEVEDLFDAYQSAMMRETEAKGTAEQSYWTETKWAALQSWREARRKFNAEEQDEHNTTRKSS